MSTGLDVDHTLPQHRSFFNLLHALSSASWLDPKIYSSPPPPAVCFWVDIAQAFTSQDTHQAFTPPRFRNMHYKNTKVNYSHTPQWHPTQVHLHFNDNSMTTQWITSTHLSHMHTHLNKTLANYVLTHLYATSHTRTHLTGNSRNDIHTHTPRSKISAKTQKPTCNTPHLNTHTPQWNETSLKVVHATQWHLTVYAWAAGLSMCNSCIQLLATHINVPRYQWAMLSMCHAHRASMSRINVAHQCATLSMCNSCIQL